MSKEKTFTIIVYSDPGHAWGKVKRSVLHNLGIANNITSYSYQRGEYVYLEEDCDLSTLCMALHQRNTRIKFVEKHTDRESRIRSYERYKPFDVVDIVDCVSPVAVSDSERDKDGAVGFDYGVPTAEGVPVWTSHE